MPILRYIFMLETVKYEEENRCIQVFIFAENKIETQS